METINVNVSEDDFFVVELDRPHNKLTFKKANETLLVCTTEFLEDLVMRMKE